MKILISIIISCLIAFNANAENISQKLSNSLDELIPGEGVTDVSIQVHEEDFPDIEILTNRSLDKTDTSNTFVQMSLHTQETNNKNRLITNLGYGYRELSDDNSFMYGANAFIDIESEGHMRASLGLEAKGKILDLNANLYEAISGKETVGGVNEEVLSGYQLNLTTQIPYMPWSTLNIQNYSFESIKATNDTEGNKISLEMNLTPTLQFDISQDFSDTTGVDDETDFKVSLRYPPSENIPNLQDGFISNVAFEKANMKDKLVQKVRRDNNLTVEIQGAVILTKK
ncbi:inverse autotransporter beta domain-containing protein [Candidatus Pelagibacter sp.]|nr:inverse autotransporter beta domain-containing protein [Candidatus Pelagibacter sp.]